MSTSFCLPAAVPVNDTLITLELPWSAVGEADKEATVKQSRPPLLSHSLAEESVKSAQKRQTLGAPAFATQLGSSESKSLGGSSTAKLMKIPAVETGRAGWGRGEQLLSRVRRSAVGILENSPPLGLEAGTLPCPPTRLTEIANISGTQLRTIAVLGWLTTGRSRLIFGTISLQRFYCCRGPCPGEYS